MSIAAIGNENHARIETRTYASIVDQKVTLLNGQITRTSDEIGSDWETVRIGIRFTVRNPAATKLSGLPRFGIGLMADGQGAPLDQAVGEWVGTVPTNPGWTHTVSSPNYFSNVSMRVGTLDSSGYTTGASLLNTFIVADAETTRNALFLDLTKNGSNSFDIKMGACSTAAAAQVDITETHFLEGLYTSMSGMAAWQTGYSGNPTAHNITVVQDVTVFNTVALFWNKTAAAIEVSDTYYTRRA